MLNLNRGRVIEGRERGLLALLVTVYKFGGNSHETSMLFEQFESFHCDTSLLRMGCFKMKFTMVLVVLIMYVSF